MESNKTHDQLHVLFFPFMAQGHLIPAVQMAKLFASRGHRSTIIATTRFLQFLSESFKHNSNISTVAIKIPSSEVGVPDDYDAKTPEAQDLLLKACGLLGPQIEDILLRLRPDCLVADMFFPWAIGTAAALSIPALVFDGTSSFSKCASLSVFLDKPHDKVSSDSEAFLIPNLPDEIELTRSRIPDYMKHDDGGELTKLFKEMRRMQEMSHGHLVNSFYGLEPSYADCLREVFGKKVWLIGPLFLHEKAGSEDHECLKWLDSKEANSVIYVSFGSVVNFGDEQLREIASGLEASGKQFVWVVKKDKKKEEKEEKWLPRGFEERMEGKGLIIRGWAPQVAILEHEAIGAFVTHCGWNSTLESVCAAVPMVTWPVSAEQFFNEKLVVKVLRIGVEVGAKKWKRLTGDFLKSEAIEKAIRKLMEGEEAAEMRARLSGFAMAARKAVGEGGSSVLELDKLFEDLRLQRVARDSLTRKFVHYNNNRYTV